MEMMKQETTPELYAAFLRFLDAFFRPGALDVTDVTQSTDILLADNAELVQSSIVHGAFGPTYAS